MKKIKNILLIMLIIVIITGCSAQKDNSDLVATDIKVNDSIISLDENIKDAQDILGDNYKLAESKSCMFDGNDRTYTYDNIVISTYPKAGEHFINSIKVKDKTIEIFKDVKVGDSKEKVKENMGKDITMEDSQSYIYEYGENGIAFYFQNGLVSEIEIYLIQE